MTRYAFTSEDQAKGTSIRRESREAWKMRRQVEMALLDRMLAEAAMPEWYPHQ